MAISGRIAFGSRARTSVAGPVCDCPLLSIPRIPPTSSPGPLLLHPRPAIWRLVTRLPPHRSLRVPTCLACEAGVQVRICLPASTCEEPTFCQENSLSVPGTAVDWVASFRALEDARLIASYLRAVGGPASWQGAGSGQGAGLTLKYRQPSARTPLLTTITRPP